MAAQALVNEMAEQTRSVIEIAESWSAVNAISPHDAGFWTVAERCNR